jgi:FKBP-type peptidyl-prolyl cis-trans isomerase FkpA
MHSPIRFRPLLLPLEIRTNPAGNVTAQVIGGTLFVDGDAGANSVVIAGTGWRSVCVSSGDGSTTINGLAPSEAPLIGGITRGIVVQTGDGEDTVRLEGVQNRNYIGVFTGGGEDVVTLVGVNCRGGAEVVTGDADDTVRVIDSTFRKTLLVDLGVGDDQLEVTESNVRGKNKLVGGEGTDILSADGGQFRRSVGYQTFETVSSDRLSQPTPLPPVPPPTPAAPAAVLSSSAGESTALSPIPFSVSFGEAVTGFTLEEMGVTNGTLSDLSSADNVVFTFNVTPTEDGAVTVSVPADVATDAEGLGNTAATPLTVRSIRTDAGMTDTVPAVNDPNFVPTGSGLATWDIQVGSGAAVTADTRQVQVFYTGWLTDGTVFDSARTAGQPATFDPAGLITGFREGLQGMAPGGIRRFRIPPELGYGSSGTGSIPGNATLIFEVKLVKVT